MAKFMTREALRDKYKKMGLAKITMGWCKELRWSRHQVGKVEKVYCMLSYSLGNRAGEIKRKYIEKEHVHKNTGIMIARGTWQ